MKNYLLKISVFLICILCLSVSAEAQRKKTTKKTTTTATTTTNTNAAEIKDGAMKVSTQIKNVSKYLYLLGTIAQGIEDIDRDTKASQAAKDKNTKNKQAVLQTIRNLRAGIAALEIEFRTKPSLKTYNINIQGISDLCGESEDLATAGKFLDSGRPLLLVVEKLSDTLVAMP
ncbi:MAG TPA: hypothetical protein PKE69_09460 [Pyrinomonadaceae bacterium]|nr:hypothetical protein [Pyrinomonadaceae bacterium]